MTSTSTTQPSTPTNKAAKLLAESITNLMNSESYKSALSFRKHFYQYSFRNCWLIFQQCPTATYVAGYHAWQKLGRQVKKGEKGIAILAPLTRKESGEQETSTRANGNKDSIDSHQEANQKPQHSIIGFRSATVFNLDQTEGEAIPELPRPVLLEKDNLEVQILIGKAKLFARGKNITISTADLGQAMGSYTFASNHITLRPDLPPLQTLKTLVHEIAHALMHGSAGLTTNRNTKEERKHVLELEAESCAFLVCDALGLDTSHYSFPYIANWTNDPNEILPAAERACRVADEILLALNPAPINLANAA
jgi:antirestriction protein ArdC